jgi:uncharacterized membrane-anchored protein
MILSKWIKFFFTAMLFILVTANAYSANTPEQTKLEIQNAVKAAEAAIKQGPLDIPFTEQATFHLPQYYGFVPTAESRALMKAMGNLVGEGFIGLIIPTNNKNSGWLISVTYFKSGYVRDDDAKDWKADELLKNIREGTEEQNKSRQERGIPEMEILGWVEAPTYDAASHRLVWSIVSCNKGQADTAEQGINYNTLTLGREGYISMNLVTNSNSIEKLKPVAKTLLSDLEFNSGRRYADFNAGTDKVAAYGLAAIVAGVAAKKLGFFAMVAVFVAKFAKVIILTMAATIGGFFKKFKRNKGSSSTLPTTTSDTGPSK